MSKTVKANSTITNKFKNWNNRSMGHIPRLRNQFKSINTSEKSYDYLREENTHYLLLKIEWSLFVKPWVSFTWGCFVPSSLKWSSGSGDEDFEILSIYIWDFIFISPLKGLGPSFEQIESPLPKDAVCKVWFWRGNFFNFFNVISPGKGVALHVNKLDTPLPRIHRAKFGWNWPSGSEGEDENVKSLQAIRKALLSELKKTYIIFVGLKLFGVQWIMILSPSEKRSFK